MPAMIKKRAHFPHVNRRFKLPTDVLAELQLYAEFLADSEDFIVTESLRACFRSDAGFKEFLDKSEQQSKLLQLQNTLSAGQESTPKNATGPTVATHSPAKPRPDSKLEFAPERAKSA